MAMPSVNPKDLANCFHKATATESLNILRASEAPSNDCACVCVVKDEAAYLPEFIHHYTYFGFSPILVMLNRTTDNSRRILSKICSEYDHVFCHEIDWIDALGPDCSNSMQRLGLTLAMYLLRNFHNCKYSLFCDADEFWFPTGFDQSIGQYLSSLPDFRTVSFCWLNTFTEEDPFQPPFVSRNVIYARSVKSIHRVDAEYKGFITAHHAFPWSPSRHIDSAGDPFQGLPGHPSRYGGQSFDHHQAFILHRIQRSKQEYCVSLLKGRPKSPNKLKDNRGGYKSTVPNSFSINAQKLSDYHQSLDQFISRLELSSELEEIRKHLISRLDILLELLTGSQREVEDRTGLSLKKLRTLFQGTDFEQIVSTIHFDSA